MVMMTAILCTQILRFVHGNDEKYAEVVEHLINVGLLSGSYQVAVRYHHIAAM